MGRTKSKLEIFSKNEDENTISKNFQTTLFQSVNMTDNLFSSHENKLFGGTHVIFGIFSVYMHARQSKRQNTHNTSLLHVYTTKNNGSYSCVRAHTSSINLLAFTRPLFPTRVF